MQQTTDDRAALGIALRASADRISQIVLETWHERCPEQAAVAHPQVAEDILKTTAWSTLAIVDYLVNGRPQSEDQARAIAATGKAPLRDLIALSDLTKLYFYWRDTTIATLTDCAAELAIADEILAHALAVVRRGSDGSIVRMAKQFDHERARLERELAIERSRLAHHAFHDALTGLPNRRLFFDRLSHALALVERHGKGIALLYLDVDAFKSINDHFGHIAGDQVLTSIAETLIAMVRKTDTVARLGGDEFVVLYEQLNTPIADAGKLAQRIVDALATSAHGGAPSVTASIGIAVTACGVNPDTLLRRADDAMYCAKRQGGSRYHLLSLDQTDG